MPASAQVNETNKFIRTKALASKFIGRWGGIIIQCCLPFTIQTQISSVLPFSQHSKWRTNTREKNRLVNILFLSYSSFSSCSQYQIVKLFKHLKWNFELIEISIRLTVLQVQPTQWADPLSLWMKSGTEKRDLVSCYEIGFCFSDYDKFNSLVFGFASSFVSISLVSFHFQFEAQQHSKRFNCN